MHTITSCVFSLISVGVQHSTKNPTMGSSTTIFDFSGIDLGFHKKKFHGIVSRRKPTERETQFLVRSREMGCIAKENSLG